MILDDELYFHGRTLNRINRAVKKNRPGITEKVEFWVFDLPLQGSDEVLGSATVNIVVKHIHRRLIKHRHAFKVYNERKGY